MQYAVITADVIDSKKFSEATDHLRSKLQQFTNNGLLIPFSVSRGDELQGVVADFSKIPGLIRKLRFICRPLLLRIGIGVGEIGRYEKSMTSWDMTGPAFYSARAALETITEVKTPRTKLASSDQTSDLAVNTIYSLIDLVMNQWTNEQWQAVFTYEEKGTYVKAGAMLQISQQSVHKRLQAAHWPDIQAAELNVAKLLQQSFCSK